MTDVDEYIGAIENPRLCSLTKKVRRVITKALPRALESVKMGIPNYSVDGKNIAAIADYGKHVNLYFFQGAQLSSDLLQGTGKGMRHIRIEKPQDIREAEFTRLLRKAARLATAS